MSGYMPLLPYAPLRRGQREVYFYVKWKSNHSFRTTWPEDEGRSVLRNLGKSPPKWAVKSHKERVCCLSLLNGYVDLLKNEPWWQLSRFDRGTSWVEVWISQKIEERGFDSRQEQWFLSIASWRDVGLIQVVRTEMVSASGLKLLELQSDHSPLPSAIFIRLHYVVLDWAQARLPCVHLCAR